MKTKTILSKSVLALSVMTFVAFSAMADITTCIQGTMPTEEEFNTAKIEHQKLGDEINKLSRLKEINLNDPKYKAEFEKEQKAQDDKIKQFQANVAEIKLPDVKNCIEFKLPKEEVELHLGKWKYAAMYNPANKDYVYNYKLFEQIASEKANK